MRGDDLYPKLPAGTPKLGENFFPTVSRFFSRLFINYIDILLICIQALRDLVTRDPLPQQLHCREDCLLLC
jgi:hypothetical protein